MAIPVALIPKLKKKKKKNKRAVCQTHQQQLRLSFVYNASCLSRQVP